MPRTLLASIDAWQKRRLIFDAITEATRDSQAPALRSFVEHYGPDRRADEATREDIEDWIGWLITTPKANGQHRKKSTVNTMVSPVRAFFADMKARNLIALDPCADIRQLKVPPTKHRGLTDDTVADLIANASSFRDKTIIRFARLTGLRVSEIQRMRIEDWDCTRQTLDVVRSKSLIEQEVWIVGQIETVLTAWVDYGLDGATTGPMWPSRNSGRPLSTSQLSRIVADAGERAGVHATFHQLRHSFGYSQAASGVPDMVLQALLGHKSRQSVATYTVPTSMDTMLAMNAQPALPVPGRAVA